MVPAWSHKPNYAGSNPASVTKSNNLQVINFKKDQKMPFAEYEEMVRTIKKLSELADEKSKVIVYRNYGYNVYSTYEFDFKTAEVITEDNVTEKLKEFSENCNKKLNEVYDEVESLKKEIKLKDGQVKYGNQKYAELESEFEKYKKEQKNKKTFLVFLI